MNTGSLALDAEALYLELRRGVQALLTPTAAQCLKDFELMRRQPFALQRLGLLLRSPVRRQGFLSNAVLALAVCLDLA